MEKSRELASVKALSLYSVSKTGSQLHQDFLAVEEPLEIRLEYGPEGERQRKNLSITMRTPGFDFELAVGFLYTEGILQGRQQLKDVVFCGPSGNVVRVEFQPGVQLDLKRLERHFYTTSSCGVCGKTSIEALRVQQPRNNLGDDLAKPRVDEAVIHLLPKTLREFQGLFNSTGGIHACALFQADGKLLFLREDVGRHNALDKLIGYAVQNDLIPLNNHILLVSGRASFELVQKASVAGIKIFAAVGAPSSLAVELAIENEMTLLGFVRDQRFNIYNGETRIRI